MDKAYSKLINDMMMVNYFSYFMLRYIEKIEFCDIEI
jgi:hypothetical protein